MFGIISKKSIFRFLCENVSFFKQLCTNKNKTSGLWIPELVRSFRFGYWTVDTSVRCGPVGWRFQYGLADFSFMQVITAWPECFEELAKIYESIGNQDQNSAILDYVILVKINKFNQILIKLWQSLIKNWANVDTVCQVLIVICKKKISI